MDSEVIGEMDMDWDTKRWVGERNIEDEFDGLIKRHKCLVPKK